MDPGTFFLLLVVLVIIVVLGLLLAGNAGILGAKGKRQPPVDPDERPTHTIVNLEQNRQDEPRGVPSD
jgi:hypothetical protein